MKRPAIRRIEEEYRPTSEEDDSKCKCPACDMVKLIDWIYYLEGQVDEEVKRLGPPE